MDLAPIDALAAHFRSSGSAILEVPSFLRRSLDERLCGARASFTTKEVKTLIESISEVEFERWCLLDAAAFVFVTKVLLGAASCLAKDQGLFRLIEALETLNDLDGGLAMPKGQLVDYKNIVGESLAVDLLVCFIEKEGSGFSRRWMGLLLVELLEGSEMNRQRLWKMPDKTFRDIGEIIFSGADRMLKIVAGKIIWQMMRYFGDEMEIRSRLAAFCQSGDFMEGFPLQDGSQWENGFAAFITDIEEDRYDLDIGLSTGYNGYQVKFGNNNRINSALGAISFAVAEIFSIYIPPNRDHSPDWVDFKIVNISRVEFTNQDITGDEMGDLTYFKLHLCDYEEDGYLYLLSMRPSSDSDIVMILCDKTDAEDFAEDVKRYRDDILKRKSNNLSASSAPVKDIQANPALHQSQKEKLDELERHRDDILKVLESPGGSHISSTTVTDPSGNGDALGLQVNEGRLEELQVERVTNSDVMDVESGISGHRPEDCIRYSTSSVVSGQQKSIPSPAVGRPIQRPIGTPNIVLEKTKETLDPNRSVLDFTRGAPDGTLKVTPGGSPTYLRSSIRVQHPVKDFNHSIDSDSELSDLSGVPDEKELEFLFRDAPVKQRALGKPAEWRVGLQKKPEPLSSGAVRPLDLSGKVDSGVMELRHNLEKKKPRLQAPTTTKPLGVPKGPNSRETAAIKDQPEPKGISRQQLRPRISGALGTSGALEKPRGMLSSGGATGGPKGNSKQAIHTFLDGVLITEKSVQSRESLGDNKPTAPSPIKSLAKKIAAEFGDTAGKKSKPMVPGKSMTQNTRGNGRYMRPEDTPTKKPRSVVPGHMGDLLESPIASQGAPPKRPRPAVRAIAGLLDDVLTPPDTSEARRKGKLKEMLVGKCRESENRTANAETVNAWSNPATKPQKKAANPKTPKLVSPEDTSIWELPESEYSGKAGKLPLKRKGRAEPKKQPPPKKAKQLPKKLTYGKKSAINSDPKPIERISDPEKNMKSAKEGLLRVNAPTSKLKQKLAPKSAPVRRVVAQSGDRGSGPKTVRKLAFVSVPAKNVTVQDSDEEMNMVDEYRLPSNLSVNTKPKPKLKPKLAPALIRTRRTIADDSEYEDDLGEKQNLHAQSQPADTIFLRKPANTNSKNQSNDSSLSIRGRKPERENPSAKSGPSRAGMETVQETPNKDSKFDMFQNTSEANDSTWRPKTRLQPKMELAARSESRNGVSEVGSRNTVGEAFRCAESSEESQSEPEDTSHSAVNFREPPVISSGLTALPTEINDPRKAKRSLSLNSEIIVKSPKENHEQGTETNKVGELIDDGREYPEGLVPEIQGQSGTRGREEQAGPSVFTNNHVGSKYENIIVVLSESDSDFELVDVAPENYNKNYKPIMGQLKARSQLDNDIEMLDTPTKNHRKSKIPPAVERWTRDPALTAFVDREVPCLTTEDVNTNINSSSSRGYSSEQNLKLPSPTTPRRLDRIPKTPLVDAHLARKAQIISWNSEGPKNQGKPPVTDRRSVHLGGEVLHKSGRFVSLYVLASEDEDRIVRRTVGSSPFTVGPARGDTNIRSQVDQNGSPLLANRGKIDSMEPLRIGGDRDDDDEDVDSVMVDIVDRVARVSQESCLESEQEGEWHPTSIKRLREARHTGRAGYWEINNTDAGLKMGVISDDEDQAPAVISPRKGARESIEAGKYVAVREERPQVRHEANRKPSTIETEDGIGRTDKVAEAAGPLGVSIAEHQKYEKIVSRRKLVTEKTNNVTKPPSPILKKRLPTLNKRPTAALGPGRFQSLLPEAREMLPAVGDSFNGKGNHPQTEFFNWLQETQFNGANDGSHNDQDSHGGLNRNLQSAGPDRILVNVEDSDEAGAEDQRSRAPSRSESEYSSDLSIDDNEDSDSDEEEDEGEEPSESKGDPQLDWRQSLPDYHRETLVVLNQISEGLLRYLMSSEELATEIIKEFEKQGNEIVEQLEGSHRKEYDTFLARVNAEKDKARMKHAVVMESVGNDMVELREGQLTLADLRRDIDDDYSVLDHTVSKLVARLEKELEGGV